VRLGVVDSRFLDESYMYA
jgi:hypothetical protein